VPDSLEITDGPNAGATFDLNGTQSVGRDPGADIFIDDPEVSRRHAELREAAGRWEVTDLDSRNGTYVNGRPITAPRELMPGDEMRVGTTVLAFHGTADGRGSAVRRSPQVTKLGEGVLRPARPEELAPVGPADADPDGLRVPEGRPGYIDPRLAEAPRGGGDGGPPAPAQNQRLSAWIDTRVKRQTNVAAFAFLAVAGLAVALYFGLT
jgi:hypothetical protein